MRSIWKYPLAIADEIQEIDMPIGAKILTVQIQRGVACMWALVDPEAEKTKRAFKIIGTGHPIKVDVTLDYIGTVQQLGGTLVWHVFELPHWQAKVINAVT